MAEGGDSKYCLFGFQLSIMSVMVLSMVFGGDNRFWWQRRQIFGKDNGFFAKSGKDKGFLLFVQCLLCILMSEVPALSMCRHTNEGIPSTEHVQMLHWACADMLIRGHPVTEMTDCTDD